MAYNQLVVSAPADKNTRLQRIETVIQAEESVSLLGTHVYAGHYIPLATTSGTDTAGVATVIFVSEIRIPQNTLVTGISYLLGTVGGTDNVIVILYDSQGKVVANSAVAGTLAGTQATFQSIPFTAPYMAKPGLYYVGISTNGTTATIRTQVYGFHNCGQITAQTFGTLVAITPPTTFTASKGPIAMTY